MRTREQIACTPMKKHLNAFLLLIHYWYPLIVGWSTVLVIQRATQWPVSHAGKWIYLLGIFSAYSLDRLLDHTEHEMPRWAQWSLGLAFVGSAVVGVGLAFRLSVKTLSALVLFALVSILYRKAKPYPLMKTLLVAIVWVWAAVALPFENSHWFAWQFWKIAVSAPFILLMSAGCILCDLKDVESDTRSHINSLPVLIGVRSSLYVVAGLLLTAGMLSVHQGRLGLAFSSLILILLTPFPKFLSLKWVGPLMIDVVLSLPGVLIYLHII